MQRIINIKESLYNTIMCTPNSPVLGWREIAESIPYNPSGDCISREDALKAVDNRHEELLHDTEYRKKHCQIDLLGIKKHILAIPAVGPRDIWISVNDRLPDEHCLFCDIDGDVYYGRYYSPNKWFADGLDDRIKNVTHWMPLPKAPNKKEGE